jgi:hypothetical protein
MNINYNGPHPWLQYLLLYLVADRPYPCELQGQHSEEMSVRPTSKSKVVEVIDSMSENNKRFR